MQLPQTSPSRASLLPDPSAGRSHRVAVVGPHTRDARDAHPAFVSTLDAHAQTRADDRTARVRASDKRATSEASSSESSRDDLSDNQRDVLSSTGLAEAGPRQAEAADKASGGPEVTEAMGTAAHHADGSVEQEATTSNGPMASQAHAMDGMAYGDAVGQDSQAAPIAGDAAPAVAAASGAATNVRGDSVAPEGVLASAEIAPATDASTVAAGVAPVHFASGSNKNTDVAGAKPAAHVPGGGLAHSARGALQGKTHTAVSGQGEQAGQGEHDAVLRLTVAGAGQTAGSSIDATGSGLTHADGQDGGAVSAITDSGESTAAAAGSSSSTATSAASLSTSASSLGSAAQAGMQAANVHVPQATASPSTATGTSEMLWQANSAFEDDPDQVNVARAVRGLRAAVAQQGGSVTLRLSPPEMGIVRIQMQLSEGVVRAQLVTQHAAARDLLNQQLGELRQALQSQGLVVDRLSVQTMSNTSHNALSQQGQDGQNTQGGADGRSRGQYAGDGGAQRDTTGREGSGQGSASPFERVASQAGEDGLGGTAATV